MTLLGLLFSFVASAAVAVYLLQTADKSSGPKIYPNGWVHSKGALQAAAATYALSVMLLLMGVVGGVAMALGGTGWSWVDIGSLGIAAFGCLLIGRKMTLYTKA